jgi:hypothetical protein
MADHVPYEIAMMRLTHEALFGGAVRRGTVCYNACIESFAIHARALIDFFNGRKGGDAADYTRGYTPFVGGQVRKTLTDKLNQQIAHITEKRVNSDEEKLNTQDIQDLRLLLDAEIASFVRCLLPTYSDVWDTKKRHPRSWTA